MVAKTTTWDVVEHLQTEEDRAAYREAVLEDGDPAIGEHLAPLTNADFVTDTLNFQLDVTALACDLVQK